MNRVSGREALEATIQRYCRARLAPIRGVACADRLAGEVALQARDDPDFGTQVYRATVRAVDEALAAERPGPAPPATPLARLAAAVEELPAPVRDVVVLRTFVGLSRSEVAHALGVSDRTVLLRQHEGLRRLRATDW